MVGIIILDHHLGYINKEKELNKITSTHEHFHRRISEILEGLVGTVNMIDDVLIFGKNSKEHDEKIKVALKKFKGPG